LKRNLVEIEDMGYLSPIFRGERGQRLAKRMLRILAVDKVNALYARSCEYTGADFAESILNDLGVNYCIYNPERLSHLPEGAFITVSNHAYGGLDGVMLVDLMVHIRSDYKLMANRALLMVKALEENFISVIPKVGNEMLKPAANINGIRETLNHLQEGHPVGFFPSGAVSMFRMKNMRVKDREWQERVLKLIKSAKVPIVPVRFFDRNSNFFYLLELIDWRIRTLRLPYELFNKEGRITRIGIGDIISVEEQAKFSDPKQLGDFLYHTIYNIQTSKSFVFRDKFSFPMASVNHSSDFI
jgi:putative hemolysin